MVEAILAGDIALHHVHVPWRPILTPTLVKTILADEIPRLESDSHKQLKVHARILALATSPDAHLEPEAPATGDRYPLRADLIAWTAFGTSHTYECGATDGRSILAQLDHGHVQVTVLPFVALREQAIHGISFSLRGSAAQSNPTAAEAERIWKRIVKQASAQEFQNISNAA
ncbi:MAG: hypothetical protein HY055_03660 [Magnetospirillum sp.]|nr:hypothetical protein [Magnetospirillum sp.]